MRPITISLLALATLLASCNKSSPETTTVHGTVVEYGSGKPIAGVKVNLRDGLGGSDPIFGSENRGTGTNNTTYTDSLGRFQVSVTGEWGAHLSMNHPGYWNWVDDNGYQSSSSKAYNNGTTTKGEVFELKAYAYYQAYYGNVEWVDSLEMINYTKDYGLSGSGIKRFNRRYKGPFEITSGKFPEVGLDYKRYKIRVKRNGIWEERVDSIYLPKDAHVRDTIYF